MMNRNSKMTLNEYFDFWISTYAKSGRKATTITNYKSYWNTYIKDGIGKKKIAKVTKVDCQLLFNGMIEQGRKSKTLDNMKSCLNLVFECALDDEIITKNPCKNIQLPAPNSSKREAISQEQIELFMSFIKNSDQYRHLYPLFVVLFNTGMRIGELAALTWDDINFENDEMNINKTIERFRKADQGFTIGVGTPKSKTSFRTIKFNTSIKKALLIQKMQSHNCKSELPFVDDSGRIVRYVKNFVFSNKWGNVWCEPTIRSTIKNIVKAQNIYATEHDIQKLDYFCPHMARHTFTSLAYEAGMDIKAVSEILGHASSSITLDRYTHLTEAKEKEQQKAFENIKIS